MACGIFPDQRLNLRLLNWPADSLPLCHQGIPYICIHIHKWCFFGRLIAKGPLTMISCFWGCDIISKSETIVWWAPGHVVKAEMDTAAELEDSEWQHIIWHHLSVTVLIISLWLFKWLWAFNPKFSFSLKYQGWKRTNLWRLKWIMNETTNKGLISKICEQLIKLNTRKTVQQKVGKKT